MENGLPTSAMRARAWIIRINRYRWSLRPREMPPAKNLTESYDLHASMDAIGDCGSPEEMLPTWSADGQRLYFQVTYHGAVQLKSVKVDGSDLQDVIAARGYGGDVRVRPRMGGRCSTSSASWTIPGQLYWLRTWTRARRAS